MPTIARDANDRLMLGKEVRKFFGDVSESTLWRKIKAGKIPPPIKVNSLQNAWWRSELVACVDALPRGIVSEQSPRPRLPSPLAPE